MIGLFKGMVVKQTVCDVDREMGVDRKPAVTGVSPGLVTPRGAHPHLSHLYNTRERPL